MASLLDRVEPAPGTEDRLRELVEKFTTRFGGQPDFVVRAPGRVNLIGEHVDYCGFPVLPIAIEQDVMIAGREPYIIKKGEQTITIRNVRPEDFPEYACPINDIKFNDRVSWYSYVLAGYTGISEGIQRCNPGLDLMVDGQVPMSAGLSSSSALVCASALAAYVHLQGDDLAKMEKAELADLCARAERLVGTQGGGMDQAISFLGVEGKAQLINFNPVRCTPVPLPDGVVFVVANCLVNKWKAGSNDFNNRVTECRLAAKVLGVQLGQGKEVATLHQLMTQLELDPAALEAAVLEQLSREPYTPAQIKTILGCTRAEWTEWTGKSDLTEFRLFDRAFHVAGEAARVDRFYSICTNPTPDIVELGRLIDASHSSLRDNYNVSIEELDKLTEVCRGAGALGSRLVGAGFGGCTVSMVRAEQVESFVEQVYKEFYSHLPRESVLGTHLFVTKPSAGAAVLKIPA